MLRRASRGVIFLTKSRVKNLCENVLSEERYLSLYPPPVDIIEQKAHVRAQFQQAVKLLAVAARNKSTSNSIYNDDDLSHSEAVKDIVSLTKEDVASGELSTEQLMQLAKLRFTGNDSSRNTKNIGDESSQGSDLKDPELAVQAWTLASKQGNTDAAYSLAFCLLNGIGTERDEEEAFRLMFPLADSYDNAYAHYALGNMYLKGLGTDKDEKLAFRHYKGAAQEGIPPAIYNLGNMYAAGVGVAQSDQNAVACYEGAAGYGDVQAKYILGTWLCEGRGQAQAETETQKQVERGISLLVEAATAGHARATYSIGVHYLEGTSGVERDLGSAAVWFEKASKLGMCEGSFNLGMLLMQGTEKEEPDLHRARECFLLGTRQNDKNEACFVLLRDVENMIAQKEGGVKTE